MRRITREQLRELDELRQDEPPDFYRVIVLATVLRAGRDLFGKDPTEAAIWLLQMGCPLLEALYPDQPVGELRAAAQIVLRKGVTTLRRQMPGLEERLHEVQRARMMATAVPQ